MKRRLEDDTTSSITEPQRKRHKPRDDGGSYPCIPGLPTLHCSVHKMKICYAANLDKAKYDKCPKCLTLNEYETMHFIYECVQCKYFVCNFCMTDLYNLNQTNRSPLTVHTQCAKKRANKSSNPKKKAKSNQKQSKKSLKNGKYRYNPELNGHERTAFVINKTDLDDEGSIASRTRNGRRTR
eukprot:294271_1